MRDGMSKGGACLDPVVLGAAPIERCGSYLISLGWVRDDQAEAAIGSQIGRSVTCYRAPPAEPPPPPPAEPAPPPGS